MTDSEVLTVKHLSLANPSVDGAVCGGILLHHGRCAVSFTEHCNAEYNEQFAAFADDLTPIVLPNDYFYLLREGDDIEGKLLFGR